MGVGRRVTVFNGLIHYLCGLASGRLGTGENTALIEMERFKIEIDR